MADGAVILKEYTRFKMRHIKKYNDWLLENKHSIEKKKSFSKVYSMDIDWWLAWKNENKKIKNLKITKDEFSKIYQVEDDLGNLIFIYDYFRSKIFTDKDPTYFTIKKIVSSDQMKKIQKDAEKLSEPIIPDAEEDKEKDDDEEKKSDSGISLGL